MAAFVNIIFNDEARKSALMDIKHTLETLEMKRRQQAEIKAGQSQDDYVPSYTMAIKHLNDLMNGTKAMQIWAIYAFFFYSTHFEHHIGLQTSPTIMDKATMHRTILPNGKCQNISEFYDRMTLICFGKDQMHNVQRDISDMRAELSTRNHHPYRFILNEMMNVVNYVPRSRAAD